MIRSVIQSAKEERRLEDDGVNFCYCDESGTGQEPIATMVGILVDSGRMHLTKQDWHGLLKSLSAITKRHIVELHTSDFYNGNGVWRNLSGTQRFVTILSLLYIEPVNFNFAIILTHPMAIMLRSKQV